MKRLLRPSVLVGLLLVPVLAAAAFTVYAWVTGPAALAHPVPLPVAAGDREIAWLYAATQTSDWERFVTAVRRTAEEFPGRTVQAGAAFPRHTTAVPEVALTRPGGGRLVFRWYKLTSDWSAGAWVRALLARRPAPLAVIGGSSSDGARELAGHLAAASAGLDAGDRPLLLLTQATADRVPHAAGHPEAVGHADGPMEATPGVELDRLHPGRTFRFCFTNRQMAEAVTHFIWSQEDLRPDDDPVYVTQWLDDSYSRDLTEGFWNALHALVTRTAAREWSWATGCALAGAFPPPLGAGAFPLRRAGRHGSGLRLAVLPTPQRIDSSVGSFFTPNPYEASAARYLLDALARRPAQRRPLLVLTGQTGPSRRFLRALDRSAPLEARRFVVAGGDAISFNTIYRDRQVKWPVQDLPFALVFFCHHNPVDAAAGFRPQPGPHDPGGDEGAATAATGTEDVLLDGDVVAALVQSLDRDGQPCPDAAALARRLGEVRLHAGRVGFDAEGTRLFDAQGGRRGGTGEHVVCLRPLFRAGRPLPAASIEVWAWGGGGDRLRAWHRVAALTARYEDLPAEGGGPHAGD